MARVENNVEIAIFFEKLISYGYVWNMYKDHLQSRFAKYIQTKYIQHTCKLIFPRTKKNNCK